MHRVRSLILGLSAALAFTVVAAILIRVMPQPLKPTDSLVIGGVATLAALIVLFVGFMLTTRQKNVFYTKRRKRDGDVEG